jgi:SAM-dependent methyltransferase
MLGYTIIREKEYKLLSEVHLDGTILDVGGSKHASYHPLIKGGHTFVPINITPAAQPDHIVDIEKAYPFADETFDHAICFNVLEHVYEFENAFSEQVRCIKVGGKIVIAVPFMHHIHGSPDDYIRYTESALRRMAEKFGCKVETLLPLGEGLFSLIFQCVGTGLPVLTES